MTNEKLFRLRTEAQAGLAASRAEADAELLHQHENALAALSDPAVSEDIRLEALLKTREWEDRGIVDEDHIRAWKTILAMEDKDAAAAILADNDEARTLRRITPFSREALAYPRRG